MSEPSSGSANHGAPGPGAIRSLDLDALRVLTLALQADLAATQAHVETVAECQSSVQKDEAKVWCLIAKS